MDIKLNANIGVSTIPIKKTVVNTVVSPIVTPVQINQSNVSVAKDDTIQNNTIQNNNPTKEEKPILAIPTEEDTTIINSDSPVNSVITNRTNEFEKTISVSNENPLVTEFDTDEMKSFDELMKEGKIPATSHGEYIISYDIFSNTHNKVYLKDIINITENKLYDDVMASNPKYEGSYFIIYHKGRKVYDRIGPKMFKFLKDNNYIDSKNIKTVFIDAKSNLRFRVNTLADINNERFERESALALSTNKAKKHSKLNNLTISFVNTAYE